MQLEVKKYLSDIQAACWRLSAFTAGRNLKDYESDELLQSAVERQFEIIGEALNQAIKIDSRLATLIPDTPRIIAFRNRLIHGYSDIDSRLVWGIIEKSLPGLSHQVDMLLKEGPS